MTDNLSIIPQNFIFPNIVNTNNQPSTVETLHEYGILQDNLILKGYVQTRVPPVPQKEEPPILRGPVPITSSQKRLLDAMRNINWSRSYLWEVELDDVPPPFNKEGGFGFPAIEVDDTLALGSTFDFEAGINLLRVPQKKYSYDLKLTFYDDEQGTLEKFFEKWFNEIYNNDYGVLPVEAAVKMLVVRKLNSKREIILSRNYLVYPNGTILGVNRTDSGPRQFMVDFVISGYLNPLKFDKGASASKPNTLAQGKQFIKD